MANHPNRSKFRHPAQRPDPSVIEAARRAQRMTQKQAAEVVYGTEAAWKSWEQGHRPMHAGLWELFKVKTFDREVLKALGLAHGTRDTGTSAFAVSGTATQGTP